MAELRMPKLGADMTEGRLVEWCKRPGDAVRRGDIIAVVETDKANVEIESFDDGVFGEALVAPSDRWLPVGTPLATIVAGTDDARRETSAPIPTVVPARAAATPPTSASPAGVSLPAAAAPTPSTEHLPSLATRIPSSPYARRLARDRGIAIATLHGSGPGGRVIARDVERFSPAEPVPSAASSTVLDRRARMREAIGAAMARSKREIPHYYLGTTIDLGRAMAWLSAANAARPVTERLLAGALLLKATALALRQVPELNGFHIDGAARPSKAIHIGTAIALRGGGLVAPALLDADQLPLGELMRRLQDLVQRTRAGALRGRELTDATITVTSLGDRGAESVFGVIHPPQLALVGFGRIGERPWVVDGQVVARPLVHASLAADHRATDGHTGALFLEALSAHLQEPERL